MPNAETFISRLDHRKRYYFYITYHTTALGAKTVISVDFCDRYEIMTNCWKVVEKERPTFSEIWQNLNDMMADEEVPIKQGGN